MEEIALAKIFVFKYHRLLADYKSQIMQMPYKLYLITHFEIKCLHNVPLQNMYIFHFQDVSLRDTTNNLHSSWDVNERNSIVVPVTAYSTG